MTYPANLKYTKEHEWIRMDGTSGLIGITDHAQKSLGDIVFVELPKPGAKITAMQGFGTVESVKAVSDLFAPVSGTVTAVNEELATAPEKINSDPHGTWMIKVALADPDRKSTRLNSSHIQKSRMPSSA